MPCPAAQKPPASCRRRAVYPCLYDDAHGAVGVFYLHVRVHAAGRAVAREGHRVCEGEADKKTVEITAPCSGILREQTVEDECVFKAGDILGYIEEQ